MFERRVTVRVAEGLHARPATKFAQIAKGYAANVELEKAGKAVSAKSAVKLMLLTVKENDEIVLRVDGENEESVAAELAILLEGELEAPETAAPVAAVPLAEAKAAEPVLDGTLRGVAAADGAVVGPAFAYVLKPILPLRERIAEGEVAAELDKFDAAVASVCESLSQDHDKVTDRHDPVAPTEDQIMAALVQLARDPEFLDPVRERIRQGQDAVFAVQAVGQALSAEFEAVNDAYLRQRAEDLRGVTKHVSLALLGRKDVDLTKLPEPVVLLAEEVSAWDFARIDPSRILGLVVAKGGPTSHVAIMARSLGLPAVVGLGVLMDHDISAVRQVAMDGHTGEVVLDPDAAMVAEFTARAEREKAEKQRLAAFRQVAPRTASGRAIEVAANIATLAEIEGALAQGAMGVGLFRTELMFMEYGRPPSEDEQTEIYTRLLEAFHPHKVIVRTLDVGGDKPVPGVEFPREENPFLGWRGVRMCLDRPDIFKPQIRALLRAAVVGNLQVMVPMIADSNEIRAVRAVMAECVRELEEAGLPHAVPPLGVMMETPAAVFMARELARHVDFFSIGTNDLTQYVMAADRTNERLAHLNKPNHPAVLAAIRMICEAAREAGIWVGVCGEAAGQPDMIPLLVGYGVDELSMSPSLILRAKEIVTRL